VSQGAGQSNTRTTENNRLFKVQNNENNISLEKTTLQRPVL